VIQNVLRDDAYDPTTHHVTHITGKSDFNSALAVEDLVVGVQHVGRLMDFLERLIWCDTSATPDTVSVHECKNLRHSFVRNGPGAPPAVLTHCDRLISQTPQRLV
jgi:hypothetical protein